jgi:hypothetical protein
MAFADPQSVTINSVAQSLARTGSSDGAGSFSKDDGSVKLKITHTYAKRTRRFIRLDHTKIAADPLMPSTNALYNLGVYLVVDVPKSGYTITEQKQIVDGLLGHLTASSGARLTQLLGGES